MKSKHCRLVVLAALSLLPFAALTGGEQPWGPDHPLRAVASEALVYRARSWKLKFMKIELGTVTFTLSREEADGERQLVILAEASGGIKNYPVEGTMTARLRDADFAQRLAENRQVKPKYKVRLMRWHARGVDVLKHKHCEAPTLCHNAGHLVKDESGSLVHCAGCNSPEHYVWSMRERHRFQGQAWDLLAAMYLARGFSLEVGSEHTIRVVSNHDMWDITVKAAKEETVKVPAGEIACVLVKLTTKPANDYSRRHADEFEGPFGLYGDISLYVDKATKQAVLVRGKVKLGAVFDVEVALTERSVELVPAK